MRAWIPRAKPHRFLPAQLLGHTLAKVEARDRSLSKSPKGPLGEAQSDAKNRIGIQERADHLIRRKLPLVVEPHFMGASSLACDVLR